MHVIATAGHVDHGKSALLRRLTGRNPDRWDEERRRGLTIGLGFVWTTLPGGQEIAFVDVPGHERFVPTMLAGVGPVPAVLFAVAADEGWMPQSAEHLEALDALGVRHGLLVVTRSDLADPGPARRAALDAMAGTSLAGVRSVAVSSVTGAGFGDLVAELGRLADALPPPDPGADVRLWVDRSFTIAGAGTVVTGTLSAGTLRAGDELVLASTGRPVRVRSLQSLERPRDEVSALARVAVNLRGVDRADVEHGDALLTPGRWLSTDLADAVVSADPGQLRGELTVHIGSAAVPVHVRPLGTASARLRLRRPLPLRAGDRLLVRDPGRHRVVARADVVDPRPPALRRRGAAAARGRRVDALAGADRERLADAVLAERAAVPADELRRTGLPIAGRQAGGWCVAADAWARWQRELAALVTLWRRDRPLEQGVPVEAARRRLGVPDAALLEQVARAAGLVVTGGVVRAPGGEPGLPPAVREAVAALAEDLGTDPFAAPDANRLRELGLGRRELAAAVRAGALLRVADGLVLLPGAEDAAVQRLAGLPEPFSVSDARKALGTSRRVAVPLLELLDRQGRTERLPDDTRTIRNERGNEG
ncbi:MAG TPA: SelB C-terminal domain-containing protein [Streptosporangiales bacterium]